MRMPVLNAIESSVAQIEFAYTYCMVLYSTLSYYALQVPQVVYANWKVPWQLVKYVYDLQAMGSSLLETEFSYTRCTVLYNTLTYNAVPTKAAHTNCYVP